MHVVWDGSTAFAWGEAGPSSGVASPRPQWEAPTPSRPARARVPQPDLPSDSPPHPAAIGPDRLATLLESHRPAVPAQVWLQVWLPLRPASAAIDPANPPPAPAREWGIPPDGGWRYGAWRVRARALRGLPAARALFAPEDVLRNGHQLALGLGARYWRAVARLALSMCAGGRFVPAVTARRAALPAWVPLPSDADRAAAADLAAAMPPYARPSSGRPHDPSPAGALVDTFLEHCVDAWVRHGLAALRAGLTRDLRATDAAGRWALGLLHETPLPLYGGGTLLPRIAAWTGDASRAPQPTVRLVLRLEEPPPAAHTHGHTVPPPWTLTLMARLKDAAGAERALLPLPEVWGSRLDDLAAGWESEVRADALGALRAAARAFAPVAAAVGTPPAGVVALAPSDVAALLGPALGSLSAAGAEVALPAWWHRAHGPSVPVRARLALDDAPPGPSGAGAAAGVWANLRWQVAVGDAELDPEAFEDMVRSRLPLVRLRSGWVRVDPGEVERLASLWEEAGPGGRTPALAALRLALQAGSTPDGYGAQGPEGPSAASRRGAASHAAKGPAVQVAATGAVAAWLEALRSGGTASDLPEPAGFSGGLRPYQRRGLAWLAALAAAGLGGCLADDMGLGKTVQVLALLAHRKAVGAASGPVLLVCPTSVLGNWASEARRFTPGLVAHLHHGSGRPRGPAFDAIAAMSDVVMTSYALLARDGAEWAGRSWDGVVLDEAQNIKNPAAAQSQAARALPARWRFALTGTPIENGLRDLWSTFAFALPGYLGTGRAFGQSFAAPVARGEEEAAARLRHVIAPFVLRRSKRDPDVALDLPEKIETRQRCGLLPEQAALYEAVARQSMEGIAAASGMVRRAAVLTTLLRLKQICDHPALYTGDGGLLAGRSAKLQRLEELLEDVVAEGDRALVFTQFATWARRLQPHLRERFGCEVLRLDGSVPAADRSALVARFQELGEAGAPGLLLLSLKAGGTGLNLTAAQHVFHFDRWWNPAVEAQATDRAHRIGQSRTVWAHKFVTVGTLEERIDALIAQKAALAATIIDSGGAESWLTELDDASLRDIVMLRAAADP